MLVQNDVALRQHVVPVDEKVQEVLDYRLSWCAGPREDLFQVVQEGPRYLVFAIVRPWTVKVRVRCLHREFGRRAPIHFNLFLRLSLLLLPLLLQDLLRLVIVMLLKDLLFFDRLLLRQRFLRETRMVRTILLLQQCSRTLLVVLI